MENLQTSNSLCQIAVISLNDLRFYLHQIQPAAYQTSLEVLSGSSVGQHTRHIIEFYNCLLEEFQSSKKRVINYALRKRDHLIESQPDHAINCVDVICEKLNDIDINASCLLDCSEHGQEGLLIESTIARELIYNIEHTIHHLAIVKIGLKALIPAIELPEHFGVAPSTIRHRQEACAQ